MVVFVFGEEDVSLGFNEIQERLEGIGYYAEERVIERLLTRTAYALRCHKNILMQPLDYMKN